MLDYCELLDNYDVVTVQSMIYNFEWKGNKYPYDELEIPSIKNIIRKHNTYFQRISRIKKRFVFAWCRSQYRYFVTLTFDNEHLYATKNGNISRYIKEAFKGIKYYAYNVDYGEENDRIHYHAVIFNDKPIDEIQWNLGFYKIKDITSGFNTAVIKYLTKYCCHATKCSKRMTYNFKGYEGREKMLYDIPHGNKYLKPSSLWYHEDLRKLELIENETICDFDDDDVF